MPKWSLYTGRVAKLVDFNPEKTKPFNVPIVTAIIKVRSNIGIPILLRLHEAPLNQDSSITHISEYQISEHGPVIDSVAKKHMSSHGKQGTQRFVINSWVHIYFEDRGGLMGFD